MSNSPRKRTVGALALTLCPILYLIWPAIAMADAIQPVIGSRPVGWLDTFDWSVFVAAAVITATVTALWGLGARTQQRLGLLGRER